MVKVSIGVDLAATAQGRNPSAFAVLDGRGRLVEPPQHFKRAEELVTLVRRHDPAEAVLAVDAPRSVPDWSAQDYAYRSCEKAAKAIDPGAGSFSGVAALYLRWYEIETKHLRGYRIIETYPRVVWARLGLWGRPKGYRRHRTRVQKQLSRLVRADCQGLSAHQVDAVLCAYVAHCYATARAEGLGEPGQGLIWVPATGRGRRRPTKPEAIRPEFLRFPCMRVRPR